ncbi:MAG: ThiF family adenylyltransferase [Oscillospiraceae bacterium]
MQEQFARSALLLGQAAVEALGQKRVAVFGVGGVGSFVVEALARSGVGSFLLVDSDVVDITNINRQLHATLDTVGQYKTLLMGELIRSINPLAQVDTREVFCLPETIPGLLEGHFDYIVDAIDTVSAKLALVEEAHRRNIPIMAAMGAGNKLDPTRFRVSDLSETSVCPLCRVMRRELRSREIPSLKVVWSDEPPSTPLEQLLPPDGSSRRAVPGSVAFVPSVAGLILAGEVVKDLIV